MVVSRKSGGVCILIFMFFNSCYIEQNQIYNSERFLLSGRPLVNHCARQHAHAVRRFRTLSEGRPHMSAVAGTHWNLLDFSLWPSRPIRAFQFSVWPTYVQRSLHPSVGPRVRVPSNYFTPSAPPPLSFSCFEWPKLRD